jgi:hypothetical protein
MLLIVPRLPVALLAALPLSFFGAETPIHLATEWHGTPGIRLVWLVIAGVIGLLLEEVWRAGGSIIAGILTRGIRGSWVDSNGSHATIFVFSGRIIDYINNGTAYHLHVSKRRGNAIEGVVTRSGRSHRAGHFTILLDTDRSLWLSLSLADGTLRRIQFVRPA